MVLCATVFAHATSIASLQIEYKNPSILVVDGKISDIHSILNLVEEARTNNQPLIIIAEDVEGDALNTLIINRLRAGIKVGVVPYTLWRSFQVLSFGIGILCAL